MAQSYKHTKGWMFESQSRQTQVIKKQVLTSLLFNALKQMLVSRVLGDDHFKWMSRVTVGVTR